MEYCSFKAFEVKFEVCNYYKATCFICLNVVVFKKANKNDSNASKDTVVLLIFNRELAPIFRLLRVTILCNI